MSPDISAQQGEATKSDNGLPDINGLHVYNGLDASNGLHVYNGLNTFNGLNSFNGLMASDDGRMTTSYLVKCALPAGRQIKKQDQYNNWYTFAGSIGLAPGWESGACDGTCQEVVSACMMAHVNTAGVHIPLWLDSPATAIGWGRNSAYPNQEGTYFGNIFTPNPLSGKVEAFYCNGPGFTRSVVPGRLGAYQPDAPYTNPFGQDAQCATAGNCVAADAPHQGDGYQSCMEYHSPITVWRQNAPSFDPNTPYKICSQNSGKCLDVPTEALWNDGTDIQQWDFSGTDNQRWYITTVDGGYYKIINKQTGKALDIWKGQQDDGARIVQWAYWAGKNQNWAISPVGGGYFSVVGRMSAKALDVENFSTDNGAKVHQWYYYGQPNQLWTITPAW